MIRRYSLDPPTDIVPKSVITTNKEDADAMIVDDEITAAMASPQSPSGPLDDIFTGVTALLYGEIEDLISVRSLLLAYVSSY